MSQLEFREEIKGDWTEILVKLQYVNEVLDKLIENNNGKELSDSSVC